MNYKHLRQSMIGRRFGKLVVIEETDLRLTKSSHRCYRCKCDCGKERASVEGGKLRRGQVTSCGCTQFDSRRHLDQFSGKRNKLGISGVSAVLDKRYPNYPPIFRAAIELKRDGVRERIQLYAGKDFFEACCARKSYEIHRQALRNFY